MNSHQKGKALEIAVREIEQVILQTVPGLDDQDFSIESRKKIRRDGVSHEIDLWVEVGIGADDHSVFIFECKNWKDKVGKNEIIVFDEKIAVAPARAGFFVARDFSRDAKA
jgi:hypothetical protein